MNIKKLTLSLLAVSSLFYISGYSEKNVWRGERNTNPSNRQSPSSPQANQPLSKPSPKKQEASKNDVSNEDRGDIHVGDEPTENLQSDKTK